MGLSVFFCYLSVSESKSVPTEWKKLFADDGKTLAVDKERARMLLQVRYDNQPSPSLLSFPAVVDNREGYNSALFFQAILQQQELLKQSAPSSSTKTAAAPSAPAPPSASSYAYSGGYGYPSLPPEPTSNDYMAYSYDEDDLTASEDNAGGGGYLLDESADESSSDEEAKPSKGDAEPSKISIELSPPKGISNYILLLRKLTYLPTTNDVFLISNYLPEKVSRPKSEKSQVTTH